MEPNTQQPGDPKPDNQQAHGNEPSGNPAPATPAASRRKTSIMDLARYRLGQRVYWIVFRMEREPEFDRADDWMKREHPWVLWRYGIMPWGVPMKPPRVHPADTMTIMMLCGQQPKIEPFTITEVSRSANSGSFLYTGPKGMVMPESLLFPTKKAARKEIARIAKVFAAWTNAWEEGADSPPAKG